MTPERWQRIERLYHQALELAAAERLALLDRACAGDAELRREVESLLASHDDAESFIESPPDDVVACMMAEEQALSMIGHTLGHYEVQSLIGAGGMGEVYRARDTRLDRDVAVKILPEHLADHPDALKRFEREAKAVAALSHPNILSIFDFGTEEGVSYAVMELLEGETLRERLNRAPVAWREAVGIGVAIAEGLAAAHAKGIIHRDLKPENLFLTSNAGVKILDFGIARVKHTVTPEAETVTGSATRPGTMIGTIGYMSPEQVRGEQADAPSDIFSLGCVLYEMASGQRPFARASVTETIAAILRDDPPVLTGTAKHKGERSPEALESVIRHCLEKNPRDRFQSARDLAFDLRALLIPGGQANQPGAGARSQVRPAIWIATSAIIFLLAAAVWMAMRGKPGGAIDSLAVLPLLNAGGSADAEYLSDGITDSLINSLSALPQLRVMARSTVFTYKGKEVDPRRVGKDLNVRTVLTGRVAQRGDNLIIGAELVNSADGTRLWGDQFTRKLADVLSVQEEIVRQITARLRLALTGEQQKQLSKRHTVDPEAHQFYLKGRYQWNKSDEAGLRNSIELYNRAIEIDPNYALAYAGLADSYFFMSNLFMPPKEAIPRSQAAAKKALEIDETLAEAHAALAMASANYDWQWEEGERDFKRAIELNPGYAPVHNQYGIFLIYLKRFDEAQREMDRAGELDPLSPYIHVGTAWPALFSRRYDAAIERLQRIVALNPDFSNGHINLGWAYAAKGAYEEAISAFTRAKQFDHAWYITSYLGNVYARAGQPEEGRKALAELQERAKREYVSSYGFALIHAGLGEKDHAFAALQKSFDARDEYTPFINVDPMVDSLRSDPRFADLLRRLNLAP